jgi:hypothetical protein
MLIGITASQVDTRLVWTASIMSMKLNVMDHNDLEGDEHWSYSPFLAYIS